MLLDSLGWLSYLFFIYSKNLIILFHTKELWVGLIFGILLLIYVAKCRNNTSYYLNPDLIMKFNNCQIYDFDKNIIVQYFNFTNKPF